MKSIMWGLGFDREWFIIIVFYTIIYAILFFVLLRKRRVQRTVSPFSQKKRLAAWALLFGFLAISAYGFVMNDTYLLANIDAGIIRLFKYSLLLFAALFLVFSALCRDAGFYEDFLGFFYFSPVILFLGMFFLLFVNASLDASEVRPRVFTVGNKHIKWAYSSNRSAYVVNLWSWDSDGRRLNLRVSGDEYWKIFPEQTKMKILTKSGRLGMEWIVSPPVVESTAIKFKPGVRGMRGDYQHLDAIRVCRKKKNAPNKNSLASWDCKLNYSSSDVIHFYLDFHKGRSERMWMAVKNLDNQDKPRTTAGWIKTKKDQNFYYYSWKNFQKGRWVAEIYDENTFLGRASFTVQ